VLGFLARVIAFAIAVSVIRSVAEYIKRLWQGTPQFQRAVHRAQPTSPAGTSDGPTVLQQDPVCGTYVAANTSLKKIVSGHVYHFCSADCRNRFSST
jgi:YHS domain-containing protein